MTAIYNCLGFQTAISYAVVRLNIEHFHFISVSHQVNAQISSELIVCRARARPAKTSNGNIWKVMRLCIGMVCPNGMLVCVMRCVVMWCKAIRFYYFIWLSNSNSIWCDHWPLHDTIDRITFPFIFFSVQMKSHCSTIKLYIPNVECMRVRALKGFGDSIANWKSIESKVSTNKTNI